MPLAWLWRHAAPAPPNGGDSQGEDPHIQRYHNSTKEQRRLRTEKSRCQIQLNRQKKKLVSNNEGHNVRISTQNEKESYTGHLQRWFFTKSFRHAQVQEHAYYEDNKTFERDRARCVYSLIRSLAVTLEMLFAPDRLFHALNCHIVDDTSTRMRGPAPTDPTTIYTIMNTVQTLHLRDGDADHCGHHGSPLEDLGLCRSLRVPTPLICLENANTKGIYQAFISSALITARGVGSLFQRFGFSGDHTGKATWKTFIFIGDALKANESAFNEERKVLKKLQHQNHLALKIKCAIHQVCLIRKPVVLLIPAFWTTLVRLSHLFECLSFRKAFATSMASVVSSSFIYLQTAELPPQAEKWAKTRASLKKFYNSDSKLRRAQLDKCMQFLNGDYESESVFHFCIDNGQDPPCCSDRQDSLKKALQLIVPFFARGYAAPLLYRFKHYSPAVSYIRLGCACHSLLIRTLRGMSSLDSTNNTSDQSDFINSLLGELQDPEFSASLFTNDHDDNDSWHQQNSKRKQLVQQEVTKASFPQSAILVDTMIRPMDEAINKLFARSTRLTQLTTLGSFCPSWNTLASKNKALFCDMVSGRFGWEIISDYQSLLTGQFANAEEAGLDVSSASCLQTALTMAIIIMSDTWRRFVHDYSGYPFKLFSLLEVQHVQQFTLMWDDFQWTSCNQCLDSEFSQVLLAAFPSEMAKEPQAVQERAFQQVRLLLHDIATYTPLSSDPVEIKNGQVQLSTSRRGNQAVKAPKSSREASFLESLILACQSNCFWYLETLWYFWT